MTHSIRWVPFAAGDPPVDLAWEEALLDETRADPGTERAVLRTWVGAPAVVIGRSQDPREVVHLDACRADGVGVYRRCSGGGAVVHDAGNLNVALVIDRVAWKVPLDPKRSFAWCSRIVTRFLSDLGLESGFGRVSDVLAGPAGCGQDGLRKVSGTAQARRGRALLWHGTLLLSMPISTMDRYLPIPPDRPGIPHDDYVTNLADLGKGMGTPEAERRIADAAASVLDGDVVRVATGPPGDHVVERAARDYPDLSDNPTA